MNSDFVNRVFCTEFNDLDRNSKIQIIGILTAIESKYKYTKYTIDDGTGYVDGIDWRKQGFESQNISNDSTENEAGNVLYGLGDIVRATGVIVIFNNRKEMRLTKIQKISNPNELALSVLEILSSNC
ncbi:hypothetical protein BB559_002301 [Furculomyces boomerangus]|uniref:CST complex subunit STN1 n=2 Tax=Harpellales TaxID=61421 RepID=A0A2T9YWH6_9FUNG|nr:hypothetical protein BB559_002301 [Furculomyces boomerangus]PWA02879.1 hypothetical protein BB558_000973 [Smittium angustum]